MVIISVMIAKSYLSVISPNAISAEGFLLCAIHIGHVKGDIL